MFRAPRMNDGGPAAQPPRVSSGAGDDRVLSLDGEPRAFVIGGNSNTLAFVNSFKPEGTTVSARLVPIAWTPLGVAIGDSWQNVGIALSGLIDWIDRTFPPEDERAFIAPMRDLELLARIEWNAPIPERLDDSVVLNIEDVPDDVAARVANVIPSERSVELEPEPGLRIVAEPLDSSSVAPSAL